MIRFLPFILIPILIVGGLGYWRFAVTKQNLESPKAGQIQDQAPIEVPKTLPQATLDDRIKTLEDLISKVVVQVNSAKTAKQDSSSSVDTKLNSLDAAVTELKVRVSSLEKSSPAAAVTTTSSSGKSTVYIPLGSGGGPWANTDWYLTPEYEISLDPANYPGYTGMIMEVTFRLVEGAGTGSVRLYNVTDGSAISGQLDTTSSSFALKTSSSFKLSSGTKTYRLQVKSSSNKDLFIQSARIKVNF